MDTINYSTVLLDTYTDTCIFNTFLAFFLNATPPPFKKGEKERKKNRKMKKKMNGLNVFILIDFVSYEYFS